MLRPYTARILTSADPENPMHVVRHNDECVELHSGEVLRDSKPASLCNTAGSIELHAIGAGSTEGGGTAVSRPDPDEVRTRPRTGTVHDPESACCLTSSNHHSPAFRTISSRALRCHLSTTLWRPCGALSRQWHPDTYPYARRHTHFVAASGLAIRRERVGHGVGDRGGVVGARHCRAPTAPYLPFRYNPSVTTPPPVVGGG